MILHWSNEATLVKWIPVPLHAHEVSSWPLQFLRRGPQRFSEEAKSYLAHGHLVAHTHQQWLELYSTKTDNGLSYTALVG